MTDSTEIRDLSKDRYTTRTGDFIRFLESIAPKAPCSVCRNRKWSVLSDPEENGVAYRLTSPIKNAGKPGVVSEFLINCTKCGHSRRFLSRTVRRWLDDNPVVVEADDPGLVGEPEELGPDSDDEQTRDEP